MEEKLVKQISELSNKSQLFDILIAIELSKLFTGDNTTVRINEKTPNFRLITKFFETNNIPFETFLPKEPPPKKFEVSFHHECNFQDLFILTTILKIFGLKSVFHGASGNFINIGCYDVHDRQKFLEEEPQAILNFPSFPFHLLQGVSVDELLKTPFHSDIREFIETHFDFLIGYNPNPFDIDKKLHELREIEKEENDWEFIQQEINNPSFSPSSSDYYDEQTFDALTDGQYGDYDDWKESGGDIDSLRDGIGH